MVYPKVPFRPNLDGKGVLQCPSGALAITETELVGMTLNPKPYPTHAHLFADGAELGVAGVVVEEARAPHFRRQVCGRHAASPVNVATAGALHPPPERADT